MARVAFIPKTSVHGSLSYMPKDMIEKARRLCGADSATYHKGGPGNCGCCTKDGEDISKYSHLIMTNPKENVWDFVNPFANGVAVWRLID